MPDCMARNSFSPNCPAGPACQSAHLSKWNVLSEHRKWILGWLQKFFLMFEYCNLQVLLISFLPILQYWYLLNLACSLSPNRRPIGRFAAGRVAERRRGLPIIEQLFRTVWQFSFVDLYRASDPVPRSLRSLWCLYFDIWIRAWIDIWFSIKFRAFWPLIVQGSITLWPNRRENSKKPKIARLWRAISRMLWGTQL